MRCASRKIYFIINCNCIISGNEIAAFPLCVSTSFILYFGLNFVPSWKKKSMHCGSIVERIFRLISLLDNKVIALSYYPNITLISKNYFLFFLFRFYHLLISALIHSYKLFIKRLSSLLLSYYALCRRYHYFWLTIILCSKCTFHQLTCYF